MPLVNREVQEKLEERGDRETLVKMYEEKGWRRKFTFEYVEYDPVQNVFIVTTRIADASKITCQCPAQNMATFVQFMPSGIVFTCGACRRTHTYDYHQCEAVDSRIITVNEAWDIVKRTGQMPPPALKNHRQKKASKLSVWM